MLEFGEQMVPENRVVALSSLGFQVSGRLAPCTRPLAERLSTALWVDPIVARKIGLDGAGVSLCVGLALEGLLPSAAVEAAVPHVVAGLACKCRSWIDRCHRCASQFPDGLLVEQPQGSPYGSPTRRVLAIDARRSGAAFVTLVIVQLRNPLVSDPLLDVVGVKPDELADLVKRHPSFLDKPSNESLGYESLGVVGFRGGSAFG